MGVKSFFLDSVCSRCSVRPEVIAGKLRAEPRTTDPFENCRLCWKILPDRGVDVQKYPASGKRFQRQQLRCCAAGEPVARATLMFPLFSFSSGFQLWIRLTWSRCNSSLQKSPPLYREPRRRESDRDKSELASSLSSIRRQEQCAAGAHAAQSLMK